MKTLKAPKPIVSELLQINLVKVELPSAPMVNTPGLLKWAINGYHFPKDRKAMIRVFVDGYGLTKQCVIDLLSGKTPHTVEGNSVWFEYAEGKYKS